MPTYKLTYFNWKARAEVSRMMFAIAGVPYEDVRVEFSDWPQLKPKTPFGKVPLLEVDGETICQSHAIEGFLARRFGLAGKSEWDQAKVNMIVLCMEDFLAAMLKVYYSKEDDKKDLTDTFMNEEFPAFMNNFETMLKTNNDGTGFFVGDELTLADLAVFNHPESCMFCVGHDIDWSKWPDLKSHRDRVSSHPKVSQWINARPQTVV